MAKKQSRPARNPVPAEPTQTRLTARVVAPVAGAAAALQALVWMLLYEIFGVARIGYWFFDLSDVSVIYLGYARNLAKGMAPYRDFFLEYPPLFVPLLLAAGTPTTQDRWVYAFAFIMVLCMIGAAILTSVASIEEQDRWRPYKVAAVFAAMTFVLGPIAANRYDAAVAFLLALALLFMMRGGWLAAGIVIGLGFALKVTPAMLLPLVLILAPTRKALAATAGFVAAAVVPFLVALSAGGQTGQLLMTMLSYHLSRPLEFESVLTLPLWLPRFFGGHVPIGIAAGSQVMQTPLADTVASMSAIVLLAALGVTFWFVWRRRATIAASPRLVALAALVTMLGSLVGSKVLSPQYFVWVIPAAAIVALDRKVLGVLLGIAMLATQIIFPGMYMDLFLRQALAPVTILEIRNLLVLAAFVLSAWYLWKLPPEAEGARKR